MTAYAYEGEVFEGIALTSCKRCGSAVIEHEQTTHTDWHEEQETR